MKILTTVLNESEAKMLVSYLTASGIKAESEGAKEYASIVIGSDQGRYRIYVEENDFEAAEGLMKQMQQSHLSIATEAPAIPNYFKRAVIMAILATITIPIVFNIASLLNAKKYWNSSQQEANAKLKLLLILILQIPGLGSAYLLLSTLR